MNILESIKSNGFKLGGSRRMAEKYPDHLTLAPDTDWDFYAQDTKENRKWLSANGFEAVTANDRTYWDNLLCDIFMNSQQPNIEILLRSDVDGYSRAFESIPADEYVNRLWKSAPHIKTVHKSAFRASVCAYFNVLFLIYGAKRQEGNNSFDPTDLIPF